MKLSNEHFASLPSVNIPRSRMKQPFVHSTTFNFADLIPVACLPIYAGDEVRMDMRSLIRMSQPLVPIMDTIECSIHAFFVPWRLIYKDTAAFFGENKLAAGPVDDKDYEIPFMWFDPTALAEGHNIPMYLGKPTASWNQHEFSASLLKERGYYLIWSEFYRNQQVQDPFIMLDSDDASEYIGHIGNTTLDGSGGSSDLTPLRVCKKLDYFTASTISPQYGNEVVLPLGSYAPVIPDVDSNGDLKGLEFTNLDGEPSYQGDASFMTLTNSSVLEDANGDSAAYYSGLRVDLSKATAASVNDVRYAFQVQRYLEQLNYGSRYFEILRSLYGVTSPDATLQRPEYLGGTHFFININQVLSTAGATSDDTTKLGQPGANSTTLNQAYLFNKSFNEFGYLYIMVSTRQGSHKYSQGILREDLYKTRFEVYAPVFANLGDQATLNKEIFVQAADADEDVFGYQEHWAELRYRPDLVSGFVSPVVDPTSPWTLANNFASLPQLDEDFILENRSNIQRCLVSGSTGPDFSAEFYFEPTITREIPAVALPGRIDHFGSI